MNLQEIKPRQNPLMQTLLERFDKILSEVEQNTHRIDNKVSAFYLNPTPESKISEGNPISPNDCIYYELDRKIDTLSELNLKLVKSAETLEKLI